MTTMEKVYLDAQAACGLKVGDHVKLTRRADNYECGWQGIWPPIENLYFGRIGKIVEIGKTGIRVCFLDNCASWFFPYFILKKLENPQHEFKPFDRVLVRIYPGDEKWECNIFSRIIKIKDGNGICGIAYKCICGTYEECIPYEGNEHLVGTTDLPVK